VAVLKQGQSVVACEDTPWGESRVVVVNGNDHNEFGSGSCGSYSEDSEGFGLKVSCNPCVRKNGINIEREGANSGQEQQAQKTVSLSNSRLPAVDVGTNVVVRVPELDRGRLAPQKCPSSRRWCQLFWALSVGHAGRPTWAAVCSQCIHSCWQHLRRGTWCALKFTVSSVSLSDNVWKLAGICKLPL